jgi:rRNA maturation endonuclease Nob1
MTEETLAAPEAQGDKATPDINEIIRKAVEEQTAGLKRNRDELLAEKKALQERVSQFDGQDIEQLLKIKAIVESNDEAKLIADGKIDEVFEKRYDRAFKDLNSQLSARDEQIESLRGELKSKSDAFAQVTIDTAIQRAASELGVQTTALPDVTARARGVFAVDERGGLVARNSDGTLQFSKDGQSSLTPGEWLESMRKTAPHWWPVSVGGGAAGGSGVGPNGKMTIEAASSLDFESYKKARMNGQI